MQTVRRFYHFLRFNISDLVERNNSIGFLREDGFVGLTNFTMKFIRKITHEKEPDFNGFIVKVHSG